MSENWNAQVSLKTPAGTLINLRGETGGAVKAQLDWIVQIAPDIVAAEQAFTGVANVAAALPGTQVVEQQGPWSQQGTQQAPPAFVPQPQAAPQAQAGKMCTHGAMVYREAKPGSGKDWKAWFCPTPKDTPGQCKPEFLE